MMLLYVLAVFFTGAFCFNPEGKNKKTVWRKVVCITTTTFLSRDDGAAMTSFVN